MAGIGGLVSAGVGLFGALNSSSPAQNVQVPQPWVMPNMTPAANNAFGGIQNLPGQQIPGQVLPQYQQLIQGLVNNPYAQIFQQGANTVAPMGQQSGAGAYNAGQTYSQAGQALLPYAQQIEQTAFDPQQALYDRLQQQITDQTRAGEAARGIATTPYGASLENDAMRKFNIDWQNAQLGRQVQGGQAAGQLTGDALRTSAGGSALSDSGLNTYLNSSGLPYSTYGQIGGGQVAALSNLLSGTQQAQGVALNPVEAYLKYLGLGNQAGGVANQASQVGLNQANLGFGQNQTLGGQLGGSIAGIGTGVSKINPGNWNWLSSFAG